MADKKQSSLIQSFKQKLIGDFLSASDKARQGGDNEKLRQEQLAVLKKHDKKAESVLQIFSQLATDLKAAKKFSDRCSWTLDELLVSIEPWPFDDLSQLSERYGPLPPGYCYRFLAAESPVVPKAVANLANNVIRIPSSLDSVVEKDLKRPDLDGTGQPLCDWLPTQPADVSRLWVMIVLVQRAILKASELPKDT